MKVVIQWMLVILIPLLSTQSFSQVKDYHRNLLTGHMSEAELGKVLVNKKNWTQFPAYQNRSGWGGLSKEVIALHVSQGDSALKYRWNSIADSLYHQFRLSGNRSNFETKYFERRTVLAHLYLAELVSGNGKYLANIDQGVETLLHESVWNVPAHEKIEVDLFVGETSNLLAWIYFMLGDTLEKRNKGIKTRIRAAIHDKFLNKVLLRDFSWMGKQPGQKLNNWTPWIISNWISSVLLVGNDPIMQQKSVYKAINCLDNFLNRYPPDGGCDEGPDYWFRNGGSLFTSLDMLYRASNGKIDLYSNPLIRAVGAYIYKVYISGSYFVNFGDAHPKPNPNVDLIYRFGKNIKDSTMVNFAAYLAKNRHYRGYGGDINAIFSYDEVMKISGKPPYLGLFWLPDIQVFSVRSTAGNNKGFYVAGKGGHNGENHNHNDVGNYIIFFNGNPFIIDAGVEAYTAATFGKKSRYSIWTMQSAYHSLPTINDVEQAEGQKYRAKDVAFTNTRTAASFSLDISQAYPATAKVTKWKRTIILNRSEQIHVREDFELEVIKGKTYFSFLTPCDVNVNESGKVKLRGKDAVVTLNYNPEQLEVTLEEKMITDQRMRAYWGKKLVRIQLTLRNPKLIDTVLYNFTAL